MSIESRIFGPPTIFTVARLEFSNCRNLSIGCLILNISRNVFRTSNSVKTLNNRLELFRRPELLIYFENMRSFVAFVILPNVQIEPITKYLQDF